MGRPFKVEQIDELDKKIKVVDKIINKSINNTSKFVSRIQFLLDKEIEKEIVKVLECVPVEEIGYRNEELKIDYYKEPGVSTVADLYKKYDTSIFVLKCKGILNDMLGCVKNKVKCNFIYDDLPEELNDLMQNIALYLYAVDIKKQAKEMDENINKEGALEDLISDARAVQGLFAWIFASEGKKNNARNAYNILNELFCDENYSKVLDLEEENLKLDSLEKDKLYGNIIYKQERKAILDAIEIFRPGLQVKEEDNYSLPINTPYSGKDVNDFAYKVSESNDIIIKSLEKAEIYKREVKIKIDSLMEYLLNEKLKNISVDELNKDKNGIRVKTLKDAGYKNIYNIKMASIKKLAAINGISDVGAQTIKNVARIISNKTSKDVKIKLSLDDKNIYTSNLVTAISMYIEYLDVEEKAKTIENDHEIVKSSYVELFKVRDIVNWFCASEKDRVCSTKAFNTLKEKFSGSYGNTIVELESKLKLISDLHKNYQYAWDRFEQNSIKFYQIIEELYPDIMKKPENNTIYGLTKKFAKEIEKEKYDLKGLKCQLRKYQEWGLRYILHQKKVLLGDEMGLGKTIQALAAMIALRNAGGTHFIVVCPASVLTNWCREISKMSDLRPIKVHGQNKFDLIRIWKKTGGIAVTNYESAWAFDESDLNKLSMVIVDEAHYIKNPDADRSYYTSKICGFSKRILFMTGTALENKINDMVNLIEILRPNIAEKLMELKTYSIANNFKREIAPVYYRRKREDVLAELPDLIENEDWCELMTEEEAAYERAVLSKKFTDARRVSWNISDMKKSSKAQRLKEIVEDAKSDGRKVIVFSFFLDTINKISKMLGNCCSQPITGSVPVNKRQEIIDKFDNAPAGSVLLAQIQSGGTGLNIQSASVVVLCEPQFKPSIENQAIARAYRMGQTRNVHVHRLLCEDTVDERIMSILSDKQDLFDTFADDSIAEQIEKRKEKEITTKGFGAIIDEEIKRIQGKNRI